MHRLLTLPVLLVCLISSAQQKDLLIRYPALNKDGSLIAFSYQGDIWTVSSGGGRANRLTIHEAYESSPIFSPDGKQIAFSGERFGNDDIFLIPTEGGTPQRLTYNSSPDHISSWTNSGKILFQTFREFRRLERPAEIYAISSAGGTESRYMDVICYDPVESPDGRFIAFTRGDINPIYREAYRGSSNRDIWLYDTKAKTYKKISAFNTNDILPQWADSRTIYFLSTNSGRNNLYRLKIDDNGNVTGNPEQLTNYSDHSIRYFKMAGDGQSLVFERGMGIFVMKTSDKSIRKVSVQLAADYRFDPFENKTFTSGVNEYAISPNGKLLALDVRGEVFVKEASKDRNLSINISDHPYRDMDVAWASDSVLLFTSDREDGNFDIYSAKSSDKQEPNIFKTLKRDVTRITKTKQDESSLVVSPDGKKIAFQRGRGMLVVGELGADGSIKNEKTLLDGWATPSGICWSPDSKWLAYSLEDLYFNEEVFIHATDNSAGPVNVSMHPRGDSRPFWSADGSKLGFISGRNNLSNDIWFVWLKKSDWEKTKEDWEDAESEDKKESGDKGKKAPVKVTIDFDEIYKRLVQVTNFPGDESNLNISNDGETFYFTAYNSGSKGNDLFSIKWDGKDVKELTHGGSNPFRVILDKAGKYLYYQRGGGLNRIDTKSEKSESLPYSCKMKIDYAAEREQIFEEAWRTMRDGFYDPNYHGQNWDKLHDKYKELCIQASTSEDLADMFNYMLGELNSSHQGFSAPDRADTQRESTGRLGAELVPVKNGMQVLRVIPESPVDKAESKLNVNDIILSVNGTAVSDDSNFYNLLNQTSDTRTLLTVRGTDGKTREVAVRPAASVTGLLYDEWVSDRKKLVDQFSKGRLGYIHIQAMNMPSFEEFERELTAAGYGKDGLVIDVRYNGGGFTTDYLMAVLNYKQHAYTIPRGASDNLERDKSKFRNYYPTGERLVFAAWLKPSIALCNEGSYSNAEIFSHAYKTLGIGKLVGTPTNGSVISTGGRGLIDGSFVRLPFRGWFTKATDKNQELGPAVPDILVENAPDWLAKGTDDQLKRAVEELLKDIDSKK